MIKTKEAGDPREQIDRNKVDAVHHGNPAEHRQSERRNISTIAMNNIFGLVIHHFDQHLYCTLHLPRNAGGSLFGPHAKQEEHNQERSKRKEDRVVIDDREVNDHVLMH